MILTKYSYMKNYQRLRCYQVIGSIMRQPQKQPCCVCGEPTEFVEINYEASFCSPECMKEFEKDMEPKPILKFTLDIPCRTKKNSQQILINKKTGRPFVSQSSAYKAFEQAALMLIPNEARIGIDYPVNIKYTFYMQAKRKVDGLNASASMDDILVKAGVIVDDNRDFVAGHDGTRVYHDKVHPRVEVEITHAEEGYTQWKERE